MKIYAFHLLNDYSGSPKVLMQLVKAWKDEALDVNIITSENTAGFLSEIEGVRYHFFKYKFVNNKFLRLFYLFFSQLEIIRRLYSQVQKEDIIYVNTVLPFGAALLGKLKSCRVVYHIHETSIKPEIFKKFLFGVVQNTAQDVIYVSDYLRDEEKLDAIKTHTLYNAIEDRFLKEAEKNRTKNANPENVLMVCSLKDYKGVNEFVALAAQNSQFNFRMVLNASQAAIDDFFRNKKQTTNLKLYATQTNLHPHYAWADIILNLSKPNAWIETFGLTIIEGMCYGLPAIVPPVGGITEVVSHGKNGLQVDATNSKALHSALNQILGNKEMYSSMQAQSLAFVQFFKEEAFNKKSLEILSA